LGASLLDLYRGGSRFARIPREVALACEQSAYSEQVLQARLHHAIYAGRVVKYKGKGTLERGVESTVGFPSILYWSSRI